MSKSTKMGPGGNMTTNNNSAGMFNTYISGSGVGASSIANRRAKSTRTGVYTPASCSVVIGISTIATLGGGVYTLNGNQTITACQTLNIPVGTTLRIDVGQTLTNRGRIVVNGTLDNDGGTIKNAGSIIVNGFTYNINSGYFYTYGGGTTTNNGTFNNGDGTISTSTGGTCGAGTYAGTSPIGSGIINTNCPP